MKNLSWICFVVISILPHHSSASDIVVAVIDTGADIHHPHLQNKLWKNTQEIPNNRIDDDGNGYIDDIFGWNFVDKNSEVTDYHGHGTHISGIIAESHPSVKIMTLKYFDSKQGSLSNLDFSIQALDYAIRMGAKIINYSGGGSGFSREEKFLLNKAAQSNILVVAAAGNEGQNSDTKRFYPAGYGLENILAVTATGLGHRLLPTSNYGLKTSHLAACGENIISSLPGGRWGVMSGTSQATAAVTQAVVKLLSVHRELRSPKDIVRHLLATGRFDPALNEKTSSGSHLDLNQALHSYDQGTNALGEKILTGEDSNLYVIEGASYSWSDRPD